MRFHELFQVPVGSNHQIRRVNASKFGSDLWYYAELPARLPLLNDEPQPGSEYPQILF
jgi:hypothetical protein